MLEISCIASNLILIDDCIHFVFLYQEWVTATDILVMLTRLNTSGDEVFEVPDVLRSYYYAISDFSIGGR